MINRKYIYFLCLIQFTVFFFPVYSFSSHIVGGEITYKFIERTGKRIKYSFRLTLFRDIYNADNNVNFDLKARISVYLATPDGYKMYGDDNNQAVLTIPLTKIEKVEPPKFPCLIPPSNIGVEAGIYEWESILYDTTYSYIITHQRCCRNKTIDNILAPGTTGSTYFVEITPESTKTNNSSPDFAKTPPIFICAGENINFNHSANDIEQDQLIYKFCSPLTGGTETNPFPIAEPPPYENIIFKEPTYTSSAPFSGNPIIRVDPKTGYIYGMSNTIGQFLVSLCVDEYRGGKLLSRMFRDFQINIVSCKRNVNASIEANIVDISNDTFIVNSCTPKLNLKNKSSDRSEIHSFIWQFYTPNDTLISQIWDPSFEFKDSGVYKGKLLLNPGTVCKDSAIIIANISKGLKSDFSFKYDTCNAGPVEFTSKIMSGKYPIKQFYWDFNDGGKDTNKIKLSHIFNEPGIQKVKLVVEDSNYCVKDTTITFNWLPAPKILIVEPDLFNGCSPAKVFFNNRSKPVDSTYKVFWEFGDGQKSNIISPTHIYTLADTYTVKLKIISPLGCYKDAVFKDLVKIRPTYKADFDWTPYKVSNTEPNVSFIDKSYKSASWLWAINDKKFSSLQNPTYQFKDTGYYAIKLIMGNLFRCFDTIEKKIYVEPTIKFYMPNAFSPNSDALNEEFKGKGLTYGMKNFRMVIWNRWGEKLFETFSIEEGWNGRKNNIGADVPQGVYLYIVEFMTHSNERREIKGIVSLIR